MNSTSQHTISDMQMSQCNELAHKLNGLGLNLLVFDPQAHCVFQAEADRFVTDADQVGLCVRQALSEQDSQKPYAWPSAAVLLYPIRNQEQTVLVLAVDTGDETPAPDSREKAFLECMIQDFAKRFFTGDKVLQQIDKIGTELSRAYEEIMLMHELSTNMKVTQSDSSYLQMACDQLTQLVSVEGIAIFLERKIEGRKQFTLTAGSGVLTLDPAHADLLQMHLMTELAEAKEALLDSEFDGPFKYDWPEAVQTIIAAPLGDQDRMIGYLVATNVRNKPDFDTTDIKLFTSVANQCMVFIENNHLFDELKSLFIGSLKALTNSIDAKDQYTRGHSERVAFISRWIAERMAQSHQLSEREIHYVYLAGLLHDIGKIGVDEAVLRKRGKLTDEERSIIQSHPRIGASILSEIHQMDDIIPGVLGHHERVDGKGYPQGLSGNDLPLIAKIISLADAFDAMTSKRVYRDAMSIRRALAEIEKGIGTQFDEEVTRVFLDSDIDKLWKIIQDGFIESWDYSNFDEFGVDAVGALIR